MPTSHAKADNWVVCATAAVTCAGLQGSILSTIALSEIALLRDFRDLRPVTVTVEQGGEHSLTSILGPLFTPNTDKPMKTKTHQRPIHTY